MASVVAKSYGEALYELAKEAGKLSVYKEQLLEIDSFLSDNKDLNKFLKHPKISKDEKKELLVKIFNESENYIQNFIQLLIDKGRFAHFSDIVKCFIKMYNEEHNIQIAYLQSAVALDDEQLEKIKAMLEEKCQKTIEIKASVNEDLLAGIRIQINDEVLDNSAAMRLAKMKAHVANSTL